MQRIINLTLYCSTRHDSFFYVQKRNTVIFASCEKNMFGRKTCPIVKWSFPKYALLDGDRL